MAPIKPEIAELFYRLQIPLCETYGLVETGSLTFRDPRSRKFSSVGKPVAGVELRFSEDGEVIVRRRHPLSLGYFDCAAGENEKTFVRPGEVATGDIGVMDRDGYLHLKGRKNELLVASNGYKLHPEAAGKAAQRLRRRAVFGFLPAAGRCTSELCRRFGASRQARASQSGAAICRPAGGAQEGIALCRGYFRKGAFLG